MGYTHYWYKDKTLHKRAFDRFSKDCRKIIDQIVSEDNGIELEDIETTGDLVFFNGDHETFVFERKTDHPDWAPPERKKEKKVFDFCKTEQKPYDVVVVACLVLAKHYFGDQVIFKSDGKPQEMEDGIKLVRQVLGTSYAKDFKLDKNI